MPIPTRPGSGDAGQKLLSAADRSDAQVLQSSALSNSLPSGSGDRGQVVQWQPLHAQYVPGHPRSELSQDSQGVILASGSSARYGYLCRNGAVTVGSRHGYKARSSSARFAADEGTRSLSEWQSSSFDFEMKLFLPGEQTGKPVPFARATADFNQEGWGVQRAIDKDLKTAWGIFPAVGQPHHAVFELVHHWSHQTGATLTLALKQLHGG